MSRKQIAAGNWKMNTTVREGVKFIRALKETNIPKEVDVVLGVPFTHLYALQNELALNSQIKLAAQNIHDQEKGAYTGEISIAMLKDLEVEYVIIGHSERRQYQKESDELLATKIDLALAHGLTPIFCCGEILEVRKKDNQEAHVSEQVKKALFHLSADQMKNVVIAYEPVWAIGTGETATPKQAQEMHDCIRNLIANKFDQKLADHIPILYGGSVKPANAKELFANKDVDGGLVGGASLKVDSFDAIINSF